ncbi:MAG: hypothetical protein COA65_08745 [Rhodospirillaceae bacterium]|nr:MAG: hypothetical protein COA65_08745 [Rhodospirillaceae bacterium]
MIKVNHDLVKKYIKNGARHAAYDDAVDVMDHLSFHIDGFKYHTPNEKFDPMKHLRLMHLEHTRSNPYFNKLIDDRRPSESDTIQKYRRVIYASITKEPCFKVINSINKIVRSEDWKIDYSKSITPNKIKDGEQLEDYAEKNYPTFGSLTNWLFVFGIKKILGDPNGYMVIIPFEQVEDNEFKRPFVHYVPAINMLFYKPDEIAIYRSNETGEFISKEKVVRVPIFKIITKHGIWNVQQIDDENNFELIQIEVLELKELPVLLNGGVIKSLIDNIPLYDSFLTPMLPRMDEAAREYSDLQAEVVQHIHSTLWAFQGLDCQTCKGTGLKVVKGGKPVACGDCKGSGAMPVSPFKQMTLRQQGVDKQPLPTPPAGYITKDTEIVKIQDERIDNHIFRALASLNMEFLADTPLNQSGKAKEVDKEELNNFVFGVAFHIVNNILKKIYKLVVEYRYGSDSFEVPESEREKMLPTIQVPEHFDLLTENSLIEQLSKAKEANIDPTIINEMQTDLINKKFRDMPEVRDRLRISNEMNPFNTATIEEVADMEMSGLITKEDAVTSLYADYFVTKAIQKDDKFLEMDFNKQLETIRKMTEEKITQLDVLPKEPEVTPPTE